MSRIAMFTLTTACLAGTASATTERPNLTRNPGFLDLNEDLTTGDEWLAWGSALEWLDFFGDGNPGHATLFGDVAGNAGGVFQVGVPAEAGKTYEMTMHVQWELAWDADTYYGLEFYGADDATLLETVFIEIEDDIDFVDTGYRRYDMTAVAPAGTAFVRPVVSFDNNTSGGASRAATVDNIFVREADDVLNLNPRFTDVVGNGVNGEFWSWWGATAFDLDFNNNGNPGHGTFFADMEGNFGGMYQLGVPASPGESYTFSIDIAFEDNWDATTELKLEFYGSDDGFLIGEVTQEIEEVPGAGYTTYRIEATAPAGFTAYIRPLLLFYDSVGTGDQKAATFDNAIVQLTSTVSDQCSDADIAEPFGTLNIDDVLAFLTAFAAGDSAADIAAPAGTLNIDDVLAFLSAFAAGCP